MKGVLSNSSANVKKAAERKLGDGGGFLAPDSARPFLAFTHALFRDATRRPALIFHVSLLQLFDTLVSFFPEQMTQPKGNLVDLITF